MTACASHFYRLLVAVALILAIEGIEPVWAKDVQAIPARALAIEKKFGLHFYQDFETRTFVTHTKYPAWVFTDEVPGNYLRTIAFCVPAYSSDDTVEKCLNAALYCAGWHQGWMQLQIEANRTVKDPIPAPHTDHT